MGQINVNRTSDTADHTAAASMNLVAVLVGLVVVAALIGFVLLSSGRGGNASNSAPAQQPAQPAPNINVNPPAQPAPNINVNPPAPPPAPNININPPGSQPQGAPGAR